jgi:hypothetical protein
VTRDPAPAPESYELVVPDGWWAIDLDPGHREANVAALIEHQWRGVDDAPLLKVEAREALRRRAAEAAAVGGRQLFLSVGLLAGVPLSASLLVSSVPLGTPAELTDLAESRRTAGRDVGQVLLPAGPALRTLWREMPAEGPGERPSTTCLDVHVPVPHAPRVLLLQFRTPMEPLAEALVDVFDAIAGTLRWLSTAPVRSGRR